MPVSRALFTAGLLTAALVTGCAQPEEPETQASSSSPSRAEAADCADQFRMAAGQSEFVSIVAGEYNSVLGDQLLRMEAGLSPSIAIEEMQSLHTVTIEAIRRALAMYQQIQDDCEAFYPEGDWELLRIVEAEMQASLDVVLATCRSDFAPYRFEC